MGIVRTLNPKRSSALKDSYDISTRNRRLKHDMRFGLKAFTSETLRPCLNPE